MADSVYMAEISYLKLACQAAHFGCGSSLFIPAITVLNEKRDKGLEIKEHPCGSRAKCRTRLKETNEAHNNLSLSFTKL